MTTATSTFPNVVFEVLFEGPGTATGSWTDISEHVTGCEIQTGRGIDETARFDSGSMTVRLETLGATDGRLYDPTNVDGAYYGDLVPMRQIRVTAVWPTITHVVLDGTGDYVSTPDSVPLSITTDIDLRADIAADDWSPASDQTIIQKYVQTGDQRSYRLDLLTTGALKLWFSSTGVNDLSATSTATISASNGDRLWVRATLDVDDGASQRVTRFYTSTDGETWSALGAAVTTAGNITIYNSTAPLEVGRNRAGATNFDGKVYYAEVRSGIGGTVVARFDPSEAGDSTVSSWTSAGTGELWTLAGDAALTTTDTTYSVFRGYVLSWGQTHVQDKKFVTTLACRDAFAWFGQMGLPGSWLELEIAADRPDHWYRLDEATGIKALDSGFASTRYPGVYMNSPTLDAATVVPYDGGRKGVTLDGSSQYVKLDPVSLSASSDNFTFEIWFVCASAPSATVYLFSGGGADLAAAPFVYVGLTSNGYATVQVDTLIGAAGSITASTNICDGLRHQIAVTGDGTTLTLYVDGVSVGTDGSYSGGSSAVAYLGCWSYFSLTNLFTGTLSNFAWWDDDIAAARILAHYNAGTTAYEGDDTGTILGRVLTAKGWPSTLRDIDTGTSTVGAYELPSSNVLEFVQQMADTETTGQTYMDSAGTLVHRSRGAVGSDMRSTMSNATFGDTHAGVALRYADIELVHDETLLRNPVSSTRSGGATGIAADDTLIAEYGERDWSAPTAYDGDDDVMTDRALVLLNRYKDLSLRLQSMTIDPTMDPKDLWPQVLGRSIGDQITVSRKPLGIGTAISEAFIVEGVRHQIAPMVWVTQFAGTPPDTTEYALYDDGVLYDDGTVYGY